MINKLTLIYSFSQTPKEIRFSRIKLEYSNDETIESIFLRVESIIKKYFQQDFIIHFLIELRTGLELNTYRDSGLDIVGARKSVAKVKTSINYSDEILKWSDMF